MTDPMDLHALADGELSPQEATLLREALKADPRAASEANAILNLKDLVANNCLRHTDDEAWKGCVRRLDAIDKTRRVEGFVGRYAWAFCGLFFVFILSSRFATSSVEGQTAQTADVTGIFGGKTPALSMAMRAEQNRYKELLGAVGNSLDPTEIQIGQPALGRIRDFGAARFPLRDRKGDLVLTRIDGHLNLQDTTPMRSDSKLAAGVTGGQNLLVWHADGRTYLLCGDRPLSELGDVASRLLGTR